MAELRQQEGLAARCLEFTILTAARSGESRGLPWDGEIDTAAKLWTIPALRMKGEREYRVPLTTPAITIIGYMRSVQQNGYVFPGDKADEPLSNMALTEVIRRMNKARQNAGLPQWVDPKQGRPARIPQHIPRLGGRGDIIPGLARRGGTGAREGRQGGGRVQARRCLGEAPEADGGVGELRLRGAGRAHRCADSRERGAPMHAGIG
jgi:hypothetical protein